MSDEPAVLPFRLFLDICEALGYDPGLVISMRINQHRVTVVHNTYAGGNSYVKRHLIEYPK